MKKILLGYIILISFTLNAQQVGMFGHSFYKPMLFNPALTGSSGFYNTMIVSRMQWTGFEGAPQLNLFNFDGNIINNKTGVGLNLLSDKKGLSNRVGGSLFYSYRLKLSDEAFLSFGVSAGVINQQLSFSKVLVESKEDPTLFVNNQQKLTYDLNAGLVLTWKTLEFGFSTPQTLGNTIKYNSDSTGQTTYIQTRHYMPYLKYRILLNEEKKIALIPQTLLRFVPNTPLQYDASISLDWNDKFWVATTYKSNYALSANLGFRIVKKIYIGYSYDIIIGGIGKYAGLSHEIMLNFKFGKDKNEELLKETIVKDEINIPEINVEQEKEEEVVVESDTIDSESLTQLPDLTTLLLLNLIKEIEVILDNPQATSAQILDLKMRISAFSNSDFADASMKSQVDTFTDKLKLPNEISPDIVIKGSIVLEGQEPPINYSMVSITIIDTKTDETVGTYTTNAKTGKFILILRPNENYQLIVENEGYNIYTEELIYTERENSEEIMKEIKLQKEE